MNIRNLTISIRDAGSGDGQLSAAPPIGQDLQLKSSANLLNESFFLFTLIFCCLIVATAIMCCLGDVQNGVKVNKNTKTTERFLKISDGEDGSLHNASKNKGTD